MPTAALTPCNQTGCRKLVKKGYCDIHKRKAWKHKNEGTTTQRGYGHKWRKARQTVIRRDKGLCQLCLKQNNLVAFQAVDHIIPKSKGGTDELTNLQCICKNCHENKTNTENKQGWGG